MEYLHPNKIVFRDLKPENIGHDVKTGQVKLFDFGLATCSVKEKCRTMMRTFQYAAPEIVLERGYSFECDVYSFAVVLWHICSLELNFVRKVKSKRDFIEWVVKRRGRPSLKAKPFPMNITRLIKECWHPNPQFRPQFKTIRFAIDSRR